MHFNQWVKYLIVLFINVILLRKNVMYNHCTMFYYYMYVICVSFIFASVNRWILKLMRDYVRYKIIIIFVTTLLYKFNVI